jgi:hypothetical protein
MKNLLWCNRSKLRMATSMVCVFFVPSWQTSLPLSCIPPLAELPATEN